MSEYVDLYQLKREQTDTGLTSEAKRTMIDLLFDGNKRSDDNITLKRWMAKHHLKSEAINLLMQDCDDNVIREDMVKRVERTRLPKEEALRNMLNSSNAVAASARRRVAIELLIGSEEEAKKKAKKKAKGKETQADKKAKKQARREKNALAKAKRSGKPKAKGNKKKK